jgi:hypothetical protein
MRWSGAWGLPMSRLHISDEAQKTLQKSSVTFFWMHLQVKAAIQAIKRRKGVLYWEGAFCRSSFCFFFFFRKKKKKRGPGRSPGYPSAGRELL